MKFKNLLTGIVSIGAGLALSAQTAQAVLTAGATDLFIGFHQTSNNTDYLIDIGPVSTYLTATSPIVLSIGTTSADLTTAFGGGWFGDATVSWGVVGTNEAFTPILYSTVARTDAGTPANPYPLASSATAQRAVGTEVKNLKSDYRNFGDATPNSSVATFQNISGQSYAYADFTTDSPNFGSTSTWTSIEGPLGASSPKVLDLYAYTTTSATLVGSFTINSGGTVTFTPVPEPGTMTLLGLGLSAALLFRRRPAANL